MFSEFFSSFKKKNDHEIPDISTEKLAIENGISSNIVKILEEAMMLERRQLKESNLAERKDLCESALIKYQQALYLIRESSKKYRKNREFASQDIYDAQELKIVERMEYLESAIKTFKEKMPKKAA